MDYQEFSQKVKSKYPQYKDVDDLTLAQKMVTKYPQYSDVTFPRQKSDSMLMQALRPITGDDMLSGGTKAGMGMNALEGVARLGRMGASGIQQLGEMVGPKTGQVAGAAARFLLPQNKLGAAAALVGGVGSIPEEAAADVAKVGTAQKVLQPNSFQKTAGQFISSTTAVPQKYTSAVLADPSILSDKTPGTAEVGKLYKKAFDEAGLKINSEVYKQITGNQFPPTETQVEKLMTIVNEASEKLAQNALSPQEAFIARSAASKIQGSNYAMKSPQAMQVASGLKNMFDDVLEKSDLPQIRDLGRMWFKASAKEAFDNWLPQNKNMSPAVLRALIMAKMGAGSIGSALSGNPLPAIGTAGSAAFMSPKVVGAGINAASSAMSSPSLGYAVSKAALEAARRDNRDNQ